LFLLILARAEAKALFVAMLRETSSTFYARSDEGNNNFKMHMVTSISGITDGSIGVMTHFSSNTSTTIHRCAEIRLMHLGRAEEAKLVDLHNIFVIN
jgi:hypothetical protein